MPDLSLLDPSHPLNLLNPHRLALQLMAFQGLLGAFDTLYHHELTEALATRASALRELRIHALRAVIYSLLFVGLSNWVWHGLWVWLLLGLFAVEIILTLWDFVTEDQTRLLPASERVTHTILAINGGAFIMLLLLSAPSWLAQPSALVWQPQGWLGLFLALCGLGVGLSGVRDALAARALGARTRVHAATRAQAAMPAPAPAYGSAPAHTPAPLPTHTHAPAHTPAHTYTSAPAQPGALHFSDQAMQVLVTGGTGFIGQLLVRALLADGHQVLILSRNCKACAWLFDGQVTCISSMAELPASRKIDVVINLAGARILGWRWSNKRKAQLRHSRVALTDALVAWIARAEHKPRLLLSASAIGYYGIQARGDASGLSEDAAPQPVFMSQLCQEWEAAAQRARAHGVQAIAMRFGLVLGQQGALPGLLLPIKLGLGGPLAGGTQWLSWIHVQDLLAGIAHLCQHHAAPAIIKYPVFNFTAPECVTQGQFANIAGRILHRPSRLPTPGAPFKLLLGEQSDLILEGQRVLPTRLLACGFDFTYPQLAPALAELLVD
jgi:uncharacterized protein (TIGR01777 family)